MRTEEACRARDQNSIVNVHNVIARIWFHDSLLPCTFFSSYYYTSKNYWNATAEMIHCIHPKPWKDMLCGLTFGRLIQNRLVGWNQDRLAL
jgi:hypothetical protein